MNNPTCIPKTLKIASALGLFALAQAQGGTYENLEFGYQDVYNGPNSSPITYFYIAGYKGEPVDLTVPGTIQDDNDGEIAILKSLSGYFSNTSGIANRAFEDCTSLKSIVLPGGLDSIGDGAFKGCTSLISITLPSSLIRLGQGEYDSYGVFEGCTSLTSVALPESIRAIQPNTFKGCTSLTSIALPESLNYIESNAFEGCTSLTQITLPDSLERVSEGTFKNCTSLTSIALPKSLNSINSNTFEGCTSLTSIALPESLNSIESNAFEGCTSLTQITLPDETNTIGWEAFQGCDNLASNTLGADFEGIGYNGEYVEDSEDLAEELKELPKLTNINVSAENDDFTSVDGVLYNKDKTELIAFPAGRTGSFTVPSHVKEISQDAFSNSKLTSITIQDTVTFIAEYAFDGASQLQSISIPDKFATELGVMRLPSQLALATMIKAAANNGLATRSELPQAVEKVLADIDASLGPVPAITSDLSNMTLPRGKAMSYATTTNFGATAFSAVGLPLGLNINPVTGVISGKPSKKGTYSAFINTGIPGGAVATSAKVFIVK